MTDEDLLRLAETCATRLPAGFTVDTLEREPAFQQLLNAVRQVDARYAFERDGRPDAIAAVRAALPVVERELLDAVIDDHACELAAIREAMRLLALAVSRLQRV